LIDQSFITSYPRPDFADDKIGPFGVGVKPSPSTLQSKWQNLLKFDEK